MKSFRDIKIGDWVTFHSKTHKRHITGQIVQVYPRKAKIIWTTWDGRGHHWIEPYWKLRKVESLAQGT